MISVPIFLLTLNVLIYSLEDKDGFDMIWRYFAWMNQTLSVFTLWAITVFLVKSKKLYVVSLIPALFMTMVCVSYLFVAPECMGLNRTVSYLAGAVAVSFSFFFFFFWKKKIEK